MVGMKDSGVEWIGEIPEEWGDCVPLRFCDGQDSKTSQFDAGKPYIALENVESWTGNIIFADEVDQVDSTVATFSSEDVLFGKLRPYLAKVVRPGDAGQCSTELLPIQPKEHVRDYLFWLLINKGFIDTVDSMTYGVKMPRTSWGQLGSIGVPVPPKEEQQAIAALLDERCAAIDATANTLETQISALERYRASVIHEAVTRGLDPTAPAKPSGVDWIGNIPQGWSISKVKHLFDNHDSKRIPVESSKREQADGGGYPYYGANGIQDYISSYLFDFDAILVGEDGSAVRDDGTPFVTVARDRYWVNNHAHVLTPNKLLEFGYAAFVLTALDIRKVVNGSTRQKLTQSDLGNVILPVPPRAMQRSIADYLGDRTAAIDAVIDTKRKQLDVLKRRRQSLIYEYVTGKRRVSEEA